MYTWPSLQFSFLRSAGAGTLERRACLARIRSEHAAMSAQCGFTLVELVIGLLVIALLTTLGIPTYNSWIRNSQIRNGAEAVSSGIQIARAQAIRCNIPVQFVLTAAATPSYVVSQVTASNPSCAPASLGLPAGTFQNWSAAEGAATTVLTPANGATTVSFNGLGRVVPNADGSVSLLQVDVSSAGSGGTEIRQLRITVGAGGSVRMCDPDTHLPTGDPRAC